MGKSADKKLREVTRGKSKAQIDAMFDPNNPHPDVAAILRARRMKNMKIERRHGKE